MSTPPSDCKPPQWASSPQGDWKLIEIKGGVETASHALTKPCILLGRAADQVDVALAHESCSRRHARFAFDVQGNLWLRDLGSTHGTTVNRKRLPAVATGATESESKKPGSRGVRLFPGDVLQFGASTRVFCIEGPLEYERGAIQNLEAPKTTISNVGRAFPVASHACREEERISHEELDMGGADASYENETKDRSSILQKLDPGLVPERHRKLWERWRAKQFKLENIQRESERIRIKGELTDGQQSQLTRNTEKENQLREEIQQLENELCEKVVSKPGIGLQTHHPPIQKSRPEDDDDVDDFYDRTASHREKKRSSTECETEETLIQKWKSLHRQWKQIDEPLQQAEDRVTRLRAGLQHIAGNCEDSFFLQNDLDLATDECSKLKDRSRQIEFELKETEKLLKIVNDKLIVDRQSGLVVDKRTIASDPPPRTSPSSDHLRPHRETDAISMPPPIKPPPPMQPTSDGESSQNPPKPVGTTLDTGRMLPPPQKKKRVLGPTMPPPSQPDSRPVMSTPLMKQREVPAALHPSVGTLSILGSLKTSTITHARATPSSQESRDIDKKDNVKRTDDWRMPAGQDGSGRTKLNAKFAGRY